jgi:hypothetical protein
MEIITLPADMYINSSKERSNLIESSEMEVTSHDVNDAFDA